MRFSSYSSTRKLVGFETCQEQFRQYGRKLESQLFEYNHWNTICSTGLETIKMVRFMRFTDTGSVEVVAMSALQSVLLRPGMEDWFLFMSFLYIL